MNSSRTTKPQQQHAIRLVLLSVLFVCQLFASCLTSSLHFPPGEHPTAIGYAHSHIEGHGHNHDAVSTDPGHEHDHEHAQHCHLSHFPPIEVTFHFGQADTGQIVAHSANRPERRIAPPLPPPNA